MTNVFVSTNAEDPELVARVFHFERLRRLAEGVGLDSARTPQELAASLRAADDSQLVGLTAGMLAFLPPELPADRVSERCGSESGRRSFFDLLAGSIEGW